GAAELVGVDPARRRDDQRRDRERSRGEWRTRHRDLLGRQDGAVDLTLAQPLRPPPPEAPPVHPRYVEVLPRLSRTQLRIASSLSSLRNASPKHREPPG